MQTHFRFQPKKLAAVLLMGGVLLAPLANHGCEVRGYSPKLDAPITVVHLLPESPSNAVILPPALSTLG